MFGLTKLAQPLAKQSLQVISKRTNITVNGPPQVRMPKWQQLLIGGTASGSILIIPIWVLYDLKSLPRA
ncbi:Uncharacterized protein FWK35_00003194 [Aphis craccivora]|uniref:Uncharacterized protein n=1 Tax=Aphis craccivora TaxID=307492 RepID=A0A6G0ZKW3_APHCR|nr:Uncharacterized protein FWK35_00003194 [Aphis craccivora]